MFRTAKCSSSHILALTRLLIPMHEKNTIKLNVQVFLRMNTWLFETCRRQYNCIKSLKKNVRILLVLITYVYHNARFKKRKVCMKINCFQMAVSPRYTFYQVKFHIYK